MTSIVLVLWFVCCFSSRFCPHIHVGIREWFRWYKTPDDKPLNAFGFDEKALNKKMALEVIEETHGYYNALKSGKTDKGKLWLA